MYQDKLQYEVLIYILALIGLPLCCCAGVGALPAGIAYYIANSELKKCYEREEPYSNQNNIYTGKIIALVILVINIAFLIYSIYDFQTTTPEERMEAMEKFQEMMEQFQNN